MGGGKAADFVVREACGFARGDYVNLADVGLPLWVDDPDRAVLGEGAREGFQVR